MEYWHFNAFALEDGKIHAQVISGDETVWVSRANALKFLNPKGWHYYRNWIKNTINPEGVALFAYAWWNNITPSGFYAGKTYYAIIISTLRVYYNCRINGILAF